MRRPVVILVALLVAAAVLIAAELATSAGRNDVAVADPCRTRPAFPGSGIDATIQRVVLDGLDGAACRLHTTREELVLSLRPGSGKRRWDQHTIDTSLRAGLLRSVDEAEQRGDVPAFLAPIVRRVVERAPLAKIIEGGVTLNDLFG